MHTDVFSNTTAASARHTWAAGIAGGLVGGIGMGVVLHLGANIMPFIGALYGWPTVLGGWVAHLVHSVLIGLLFAIIVSHPLVHGQTDSVAGYTVAGIIFAAAVGLVTGGVMLPIAMNAIGAETLPETLVPLPGVIGDILVVISFGVAHVVYGLLLGATYGIVHTSRPGVDSADQSL